jgi:hypothetical protein
MPPMPPLESSGREPMTAMEQVYMTVIVHWYKHVPDGRAPSIADIRAITRRHRRKLLSDEVLRSKGPGWPSSTAMYSALLSLERKGYLLRSDGGKFSVIT